MFLKINIFLPFLFVSRGKTNAALGPVQSNHVHFQHPGIPDPLESCLIKHELTYSLTQAPWLSYHHPPGLPPASGCGITEQLVRDEEKQLCCFDAHISQLPLRPLNYFSLLCIRTIGAMQLLYIFSVNSSIAFGGIRNI